MSGLPFNKLMGNPMLSSTLTSTDRSLVIIRLKGGNDGLNTIVPVFDYSTYASFRPNLKIPQANLLPLDSMYSVPNFASSLKNMWDSGMMKVIHNVGYDDQDLSHFVSSDVMDSSNIGSVDASGWMGRYLWDQNPDFISQPPLEPLAIQVGGDGNILFFNEDSINMAMNVIDPVELYNIVQTGSVYNVVGNAQCYYDDQLDFMKSMINSTYTQSQSIYDAFNNSTNAVAYPAGLGESLSVVSRLIKGGLGTKIYMLTLDGFDTHASQDTNHPDLLTELGDSVKAFYNDLNDGGVDENVLCMTFSEFGRRVDDNFSMGTDHGTAAPWFMFGAALGGNGFVGDNVDMSDLDIIGNLKHTIDFRNVYSTILQDWLCANELLTDTILGGQYNKLQLGFNCVNSATPPIEQYRNLHQLRYHDGVPYIFLTLPESANVKLEAFNMLGKKIASTNNDYFSTGTHRINIPGANKWASGAYMYSLYISGKMESGKMQKH